MSRDTTVADRTAAFEEAFGEAPRAQLPAEVQQIMIDERPRGAISVHVKRDELEVLRKIKTIATAAGDDFFYSWPTKNKDGTKGVVEGPSVKCANAVSRIFGNCSVKVRVFDQGPHWIFYAQFYDMETGYVLERPFQQRKAQNIGGGMDKDRATDIVFQIGTSKAARNVVCNALSEFTDYAFAVAKEQLVEKVGKRLDYYRDQVRERLGTLKVDVKRVELVRGKVIATWLAGDVAKTIAEIQAVNDGMGHPEELWPLVEGDGSSLAGAPKPQPEDFKPEAGAGGKAPDPAQGAQQQGQQGQAPATAAAEGGKTEPAQAAAAGPAAADSGAQAGTILGQGAPSSVQPAQEAGQAAQGEAQAGAGEEAGQASQADGEGPSATEEALQRGEEILQRASDNLINLRTVEEIDQAAPSIVEILQQIEGLDPEDLAVLLNRWKSAQLERKRDIGRRGKGRR